MSVRTFIVRGLAVLVWLMGLPAFGGELTVRVMSYNIRYDNPADSLDNWRYRKAFIATMVRYHKAAIIGIQEGLRHQVREFENLLTGFKWCGVGRDDGKEAGEFSAIFYDSAKFALLKDITFWLSPTPETPSRGWDAALNRIVTWGQFKDRQSGGEFFVFNTHFDHRGVRAREESARLLRSRIASIAGGKPVIVIGDLNSSDTDAPYAVLTAKSGEPARLFDSFLLSPTHHGPLKTYSGFDIHKGIIGERIDFVFVSDGIRVLQHATLSDFRSEERFPSDHLPVIAELLIP